MTDLKVLSVASELYPFVKTGGLADVVGALPGALAAEGVAVTTLVPGYPAVLAALAEPEIAYVYHWFFGGDARLLRGKAAGLDLLVLDAPHLYDRPGNPYMGGDGRDWPDNPIRFAALSRIAADLGLGFVPSYKPDIVHAHDWPTGLTPRLSALFRTAASAERRHHPQHGVPRAIFARIAAGPRPARSCLFG